MGTGSQGARAVLAMQKGKAQRSRRTAPLEKVKQRPRSCHSQTREQAQGVPSGGAPMLLCGRRGGGLAMEELEEVVVSPSTANTVRRSMDEELGANMSSK